MSTIAAHPLFILTDGAIIFIWTFSAAQSPCPGIRVRRGVKNQLWTKLQLWVLRQTSVVLQHTGMRPYKTL